MPRPPVKEAEPTPPAKPSRSSTLVPILATLVVVGGAGGAWFSGALDSLLGPSYPIADPFTLMVEKTAEGTAQATGFIPAPEMQEALESTIAELGGTTTLSLASGEITETWAPGVLDIVKRALPLDEFRISITNDVVTVSGLAPSRDALANVQAAFSEGFPAGLNGSAQIGLGPRFLPPAQVEPLLDARADCGRLQLMSPPPVGYGLEDTVIVNGRFASDLTRAALESDIANLAGDRTIRVEGEILNASLCQIDAVLPKAGPGGFDVRLGYGDRTGENLSGRYVVGENPTIDIKLPEDTTDGYLWVSVIDVKGVVFHLLPNRTRPDNSIATLRAQAQDGFVRVAYGLQEAQKDGLLAFTVDDSVLGKSKIIALHSDAALFDELRPTTESAASYAAALTDAGNTAGFYVNSLDSALLTTSR